MSNEELVLDYQARRDPETLLLLYEQNIGLIRRAARRFMPDEPEDAMQEAFFSILRSAELYREEVGAKYTTVLWYRLKATLLRYRQNTRLVKNPDGKRPVSLDIPIGEDDNGEITLSDLLPGSETVDTEELQLSEFRKTVAGILATVPGGQIVERYYLQGRTLAQIAESTGEPVEVVTRMKREALKVLRSSKVRKKLIESIPEQYQGCTF